MTLQIKQINRYDGLCVEVSAVNIPAAFIGKDKKIGWWVSHYNKPPQLDPLLVQQSGPVALLPTGAKSLGVSAWFDPTLWTGGLYPLTGYTSAGPWLSSDHIAITATNDFFSIYIMCTCTSIVPPSTYAPEITSFEYTPAHPALKAGPYSVNNVELTAGLAYPGSSWSTNLPNTLSNGNPLVGYWQIDYVDGIDPVNGITLNGNPVAFPLTVYGTSGFNAMQFQASATTPKAFNISFNIVDPLNTLGYRSTATFPFETYPPIKYGITETAPASCTVAGYVDRVVASDIPITTAVRWRVYPASGINVKAYAAGVETNYPIPGNGWGAWTTAAVASALHIYATQFFYTYTITIDTVISGTYTSTETFRPYLQLTNSSVLSARLIADSVLPPTRSYTLNIYGYTPNPITPVFHNLANDQLVAFANNSLNDGIVGWDTYRTSPYMWYPTEPFLVTRDLIPFYIDVTTSTSTSVPKVCSYSVSVSALSGWIWNDSSITYTSPINLVTGVNFSALEWVGAGQLNPKYRINNELDTTLTLYRSAGATFKCTISNTSVVPSGILAGAWQFTFDDGVTALPYNFTSFTKIMSSSHAPCVCSVSLTAVGVSAIGWVDALSKEGLTKYINFISYFPNAEAFTIWPQTTWNGTIFVPTTPYTNVYGVTAWGHCHTEVFHLSALNNYAGATYLWFISGADPLPYPLNSTEHYVASSITSSLYTSAYPVFLHIYTPELPASMPQYHYDDNTGLLVPYQNFGSTYTASTTSRYKEHIRMFDFEDFVGQANFTVGYNPIAVTGENIVLSAFASFSTALPIVPSINNSYTWTVCAGYWSIVYNETEATKDIPLGIGDEGNAVDILKFEYSPIQINLDFTSSFLSKDPSVTDWCEGGVHYPITTHIITAVPLKPFIYTSNKYTLTGESILFENLVPELTGNEFTWRDRTFYYITTTSSPYITSYTTPGAKSITLTMRHTSIDGNVFVDRNQFDKLIVSLPTFTTYTSAINRIYGQTPVVMPYRKDICEMPPNEWLTYDNINLCFWKLNENLIYLENASRLYAEPPSEFYGWFGALSAADTTPRTHWRVNLDGLSYGYTDYKDAIPHRLHNVRDCYVKQISGVGDNIMFVSNGTEISILSSDFHATEIDSISYKGIGDNFVEVRAIGVDSDNRIYVLDGPKNRVIVYSYNFDLKRWTLMYDWGGLGGANAKTKFRNPQDLYVDHTNAIWIADTDNLRVKKYTRTGSWLATFWCDLFTSANKPLSMVLDDSGKYIHILTPQAIVVFDQEGNYITNYMPSGLVGADVKRIEHCQDGGFFYVLASDKIAKIQQNGVLAGWFGQNTNQVYTNLFHDAHRNLYITGNYFILKFIDKIDILDLTLDITTYTWPMSTIYINKDEYIQDWVLNRSFARMWDNIELFRRSIIGHFDYRYVDQTTRIPVIRTLSPDEYEYTPFTKEQIYVGVNELVTAPVINRCIDKLFSCVDVARSMISR